MNKGVVRKLRQAARVNWMEFYLELCKWTFGQRLRFCWSLLRKMAP